MEFAIAGYYGGYIPEWGIPQFPLIGLDVHEMIVNHQIHAFGWVLSVLHASG